MKHKLVVIGCVGMKRAYLDISKEEALKSYLESEHQDELYIYEDISEFDFDDEFWCYDAGTKL